MSELMMTEMAQGRTPVYGMTTGLLEFDAPKSILLKELIGNEAFSSIARATSLHDESLSVFQDTIRGTGWSSIQEKCVPRRHESPFPARNEKQENAPLEKAASDRITLLARKYIEKETFSDEEKARLAIVTARARQLAPAITLHQIESLNEALEQIKQVEESDRQIRESLGIKF